MTGFGNNALKVLTDTPFIDLIAVFTSAKQATPFPYYKCEKLETVVRRKDILLFEGLSLKDEETQKVIKKLAPDLIIVSSFNQILPKSVISLPKIGVINVHPSLLPKYRSATPIAWALMNGEKETGVTVHFIDDETVDTGRIITQEKLKISNNDTDGILRQRLAGFSEKVLREALYKIKKRGSKGSLKQEESEATYFPKCSLKDAIIDINKPFVQIVNKIRATSPYPGAHLKVKGKEYIARKAVLAAGDNPKIEKNNDKILAVKTRQGVVIFHVIDKKRLWEGTRVVDLKKEERFLRQYVNLRNRYENYLLTLRADFSKTKEWLKETEIEIWGLAKGKILLGVVILYLNKNGEIAFFARYPNKGIGGRLLDVVERNSRKKKIPLIWAWVLKDNFVAQHVFEKKGFKKGCISNRSYKGLIKQGIRYTKYLGKNRGDHEK